MISWILSLGQREIIFSLVLSYLITHFLLKRIIKEKKTLKLTRDILQNSIFLSFALNRILFLIAHLSALKSPLSIFQGRNSLLVIIITAVSLPLFYIILSKMKKEPSSMKAPVLFSGTFSIVMIVLFLVTSPLNASGKTGVNRGEMPPNVMINEAFESYPGLFLNDLQGEWVILNFWATWCPPCRAEMPDLERFYTDFGEEVFFLAINMTPTEKGDEQVLSFLRENNYTMPIQLDSFGKLGESFEVESIPTTVIINPQGIIEYRIEEALSYDFLKSFLIK